VKKYLAIAEIDAYRWKPLWHKGKLRPALVANEVVEGGFR